MKSDVFTAIKKKTLSEQYEMYIHFKKCKHHNEEAFETLCSELNTIRNGPKRSTLNWKKIFSEWESKVKAKARRIYMEREITGGGVPIIEILNDLERRLLEVLSKVLIYGHPKVIELGFLKCKKLKRAPPTIVARKLYKRKRHLKVPMDLRNLIKDNSKKLVNSLLLIKNSLQALDDAIVNFIKIQE
ncbi:hypothetical protein PPYR_09877 [Photinus pyralis]|uniref:Regulatory protein zeste n=1 Tax=Photinus pyralis TaxID=7054 RepID=A0A5N4AEU0_PHOPY|nr:hypothetical protein PPYR_09877 [Photinus pyralis]